MKRIYLSLIMLGILSNAAHSQNTGGNYLRTRTYINTSGAVQEQTVYYDGLGRPIETVAHKATPGSKDLVTLQEYDEHGRESRTWLPAMPGGNTGAFVATATVKSGAEALNKGDDAPFTRLEYEPSPLNRVVKEYGPGTAWAAKPVQSYYTGNSITNTYSYSGPNSIIAFAPTVGGSVQKRNYANIGNFFVTRITDEDGNHVYEFKDKQGRVVLTRQLINNEQHSTYYVYDDAGNLRYVLPPILADSFEGSGVYGKPDNDPQMMKYAYIYRYDGFNRCIYKKLPGCDPIYYIYDKGGRLIFSQDGEQRKTDKWTFTIPDVMGRTVLTGTCTHTMDYTAKPLANIVVKGTWGANTTTNMGYTISGVTLSSPVILSASYYDNYAFLGKHGFISTSLDYKTPETGFGTRYGGFKGLLTGQATLQLNGAGTGTTSFLYTTFHYDDRGRVIQRHSTNHMGGIDSEYMAYNLVGDVLKRKHTHVSTTSSQQTELYTYTYDHARRLQRIRHQWGSDPADTVLLAVNTYNDLGQLVSTQRHEKAALKTTYAYNVRSWLTSQSTGSLFSQNLYYNQTYGGNTARYNGNISAMSWNVYGESTTRGYNYTYDALSRLIAAGYLEGGSASTKYNTSYTYDKQGNILTLQRYGKTGASTYGLVDNLTYTLDGNKLLKVEDAVTTSGYGINTNFVNGTNVATEYVYDANGNLTQDLNKNISNIQYNVLNLLRNIGCASEIKISKLILYSTRLSLYLPGVVTFSDGSTITYTYGADGTKLRTVHVINGTTTTTNYCGNVIYNGTTLSKVLTEGGYMTLSGSTPTYYYFLKDHQGNNRVVVDQNGTVSEKTHYYPFGGLFADSDNVQPYKYNGKEYDTKKGLNLYDYGARHYDAALGRFMTVEPLENKFYPISSYAYCINNPLNYIDPLGTDTVFVQDQSVRPQDRGVAGETYTATIQVVQNGKVVGTYEGSSYPNSSSNKDNSTPYNTVKEGEYDFNNASGHKGGTEKGLNIVDENGARQVAGIDKDGNDVQMTNVNVHSGKSDRGNYNSRGSKGCITIAPKDSESFFSHFKWNSDNPNVGTSVGKIIIQRSNK